MFDLYGVSREPVDGVILRKAVLFCRGGKQGITTHLYGYTYTGNCQVCSPIREIQEKDDKYVFITRSYNKYVVNKKHFGNYSIQELTFLLTGWLYDGKVLKIVDLQAGDKEIPLFEGKPKKLEKELKEIE